MCIPGLQDDDIDTPDDIMPAPKKKEKRRNSEKRKERSRDAARSRRSKEAEYFSDLAASLPYPESLVAHLDKASIMRLSITYLKLKNFVDSALPEWKCSPSGASPWSSPLRPAVEDSEESVLLEQGLDHSTGLVGLLFVVSKDGEIIYVSENVLEQLGLQQVDLLGGSMFDYVHPCDHDEFRSNLVFTTEKGASSPCPSKSDSSDSGNDEDLDAGNFRDERKIFSIRIKCNNTCNKNRTSTGKSPNHKVLHCSGRLIKKAFCERSFSATPEGLSDVEEACDDDSDGTWDEVKSRHPSSSGCSGSSQNQKKPSDQKPHLVFIAETLEKIAGAEMPYQKGSFHSKHSLNMKFTDVCDSVTSVLGYSKSDLIGKSVFHFHHVLDAVHLEKTFKTLFQKGHCRTGHYRLLGKTGGYAWAVTEATVIYGRKSQKPESVSCHNIIISGLEHTDEVISAHQLEWSGGGTENDDFQGTEPKIEPPDFPVDVDTEPKRGNPPAEVDFDETLPRPKLNGHRLNLSQVLDENFRKEIVGFHPMSKAPCFPVIVQHKTLGSFLTFVPSKEMADVLAAVGAVTRKGWREETEELDNLLVPPFLRDEDAIFEDVIAHLEGTVCCPSPSSDCSRLPPSAGPHEEAEPHKAADPRIKAHVGHRGAVHQQQQQHIDVDLNSCLYSPAPEEDASPGDRTSESSSMLWNLKKEARWSGSVSSSDDQLESEALELNVREDECNSLMDDDFPLINGSDTMWCSAAAATSNSCETDEIPPGKKVKNWLMNGTNLVPAHAHASVEPSVIDDVSSGRHTYAAPHPKGKGAAASASKPHTGSPGVKQKPPKAPKPASPGKLKNGLKKPFSRNVILGHTYPYSITDGDWRIRANRSAELRGTGSYPNNRLISPIKDGKPKEPGHTRPVPLLLQPEPKPVGQHLAHVTPQVAQMLKLLPGNEVRLTTNQAFFTSLEPTPVKPDPPPSVKRSGAPLYAELLEPKKIKRPDLIPRQKSLLTTGTQTLSGTSASASVPLKPPTPIALLKAMGVDPGDPPGSAKFNPGFGLGLGRGPREGTWEFAKMGKSFSTSLLQPEMHAIPSLLEITQQDCDVNAPLSNTNGLLQGSDLLRALEMNNFAD